MKETKGITLVTLIIIIVVLLILSSVTLNQIKGEEIIKRADENKLMIDYQAVNNDLKMYKLKQKTLYDKDITDESLIGKVYKKVKVADTYRELAVIVDFNEIDSKPTYGKGGYKFLKEDNNDKTITKDIETLSDLKDVYLIDLTDGTFYYVNGEQIYSLDAEKTEVELDETISKKYAIETPNLDYYEKLKFITVWKTTKENEEIILPFILNKTAYKYDCTINYGDGTPNVEVNGVLTEDIKHTYSEPGEYEVKITGSMSAFSMNLASNVAKECKDKLIGIKQWGEVNSQQYNFYNCSNLTGIIPKPTKNSFNNLTNLNFQNCSNLEGPIPSTLFENPGKITNLQYLFSGCSNLNGPIPEDFLDNFVNLTSVSRMFQNCTKISNIPEGIFEKCSKLTNVSFAFYDTGITTIPKNIFDTNSGQNNVLKDLSGTFANTNITDIPEGIFDLCSEVNSFGTNGYGVGGIFEGCTLIEKIPDKLFYYNTKATDFSSVFEGCTGLKQEIPEDLFANCPKAKYFWQFFKGCSNLYGNIPQNLFVNNIQALDISSFFYSCKGLTGSIPENLFAKNTKVTLFSSTFFGCINLTGSIPENLFANNTEVTKFNQTFYNCRGLTGNIPKNLFKNNTKVINFKTVFYSCSSLKQSELYIGSPSVTDFVNFPDSLISKIHVPVNSTTYDTYVAVYGTEKVVTY